MRDQASIRLSRVAFTRSREIACVACGRKHKSREEVSLCSTCRARWKMFWRIGKKRFVGNRLCYREIGEEWLDSREENPETIECDWCKAEVRSRAVTERWPFGPLCLSCQTSSDEPDLDRREFADSGYVRRRRIERDDLRGWLYDAHFVLRQAEPEPSWIGDEQITEAMLETMPAGVTRQDVEEMKLRDFVASQGSHLNPAHDKTGNPVGRPKEGEHDPEVVAAIIKRQGPIFSIEEYRAAASKRGPRNGSLPIIEDLSRVLHGAKKEAAAAPALAVHFGIREQRVYALLAEAA